MTQRQWIAIACAFLLGLSASAASAQGKGGRGGGLAAGEPSGGPAPGSPGGASGGVAATSVEPAAPAPGPIAVTVGAGTVATRPRECGGVVSGNVARAAAPVYPNGVVEGPSPAGVSSGPIVASAATPAQPGLPGC
jgi:hypothetical protein